MPVKPRHLFIGAGLIVVGGLAWGISRTARTARELEVRLIPSIKKWGFDRIDIELDVRLKNQTGGSLNIIDLEVKLFHNDPQQTNPIASIKVPGTISIPANYSGLLSEQAVYGRKLLVVVPYTTVLALAPAIVKAFAGNGPAAKIDVVAPMKVSSPTLVTTSYTYTEQISIGGGN